MGEAGNGVILIGFSIDLSAISWSLEKASYPWNRYKRLMTICPWYGGDKNIGKYVSISMGMRYL